MIEYPLLMIFPAAMILAAIMDLTTMTIPNRVSLALVAAFCVVAPLAGISGHGLLSHAGAGAAMLCAGFALFSLGYIGGGDAKLLAAGSLWFGFEQLVPYLAHVAVLGGLLALAVLVYRRFVPAAAIPGPAWAVKLHTPGGGLPYGVAIAGAALLLYPSTKWYLTLAA